MVAIEEKIKTLSEQLEQAVSEYNQAIEAHAALREQIISMSGALKVLKEMEEEGVAAED